jgi:hypothetical protein
VNKGWANEVAEGVDTRLSFEPGVSAVSWSIYEQAME